MSYKQSMKNPCKPKELDEAQLRLIERIRAAGGDRYWRTSREIAAQGEGTISGCRIRNLENLQFALIHSNMKLISKKERGTCKYMLVERKSWFCKHLQLGDFVICTDI